MACVAALAAVFTVSQPQPIYADDGLVPPHVPDELEVPAGNKAFLRGHAIGTQNYICLPSASGVSWTLFGPQATLFNNYDVQIITHFLSSTVWARAQREFPVGEQFPGSCSKLLELNPAPLAEIG
jgi:Protein of unknown function (DUF3455)